MSGAPAALLASLLWGTADFLAGRASRTHPAVLVASSARPRACSRSALVLALRGFDSGAFVPGALAGVFGVVGVLAFYRALALGTMSIVAPIVATCAIVPVAAGVLLDGERPGHAAVDRRDRRARRRRAREPRARRRRRRRAQGAPARADRRPRDRPRARRSSTAPPRTTRSPACGWRAPSPRPCWASSSPGRRPRAAAHASRNSASIGLLDTGANSAFAIATTGGLLSLIAVLGGLFPVVTVALAYFLLHERLQPLQRAGVILALAGIPLIST